MFKILQKLQKHGSVDEILSTLVQVWRLYPENSKHIFSSFNGNDKHIKLLRNYNSEVDPGAVVRVISKSPGDESSSPPGFLLGCLTSSHWSRTLHIIETLRTMVEAGKQFAILDQCNIPAVCASGGAQWEKCDARCILALYLSLKRVPMGPHCPSRKQTPRHVPCELVHLDWLRKPGLSEGVQITLEANLFTNSLTHSGRSTSFEWEISGRRS